MAEFLVEYLVVVSKPDSLCDSAEAFDRLLQVNSAIKISEGCIHFETLFVCGYTSVCGEVPDKDQRYFHVKFTKGFDESPSSEDLANFSSLLRIVRRSVGQAGGQIESLWDDISGHYSQHAYPMIYEVENLMRKLIANFMLVNIGKDWDKVTSPKEFADARDRSQRNGNVNVLQTVDFIHLADFLFKPYSAEVQTVDELWKKIASATSLQELGRIHPESNWKRYFSKLISFEDQQLNKKWKSLYDLRCKVAHNAFIERSEFEEIVKLTNDLKEALTEAINKLPQVILPPEEKESVSESIKSSINVDDRPAFVLAAIEAYEKKAGELPTEHTMHFFQTGATPLEWLNSMGWRDFLKNIHLSYYFKSLPVAEVEEILRAFGAANLVQYQQRQLTLEIPEEFRDLLTECVCDVAVKSLNDFIPRGVPFKTIEIVYI